MDIQCTMDSVTCASVELEVPVAMQSNSLGMVAGLLGLVDDKLERLQMNMGLEEMRILAWFGVTVEAGEGVADEVASITAGATGAAGSQSLSA